MAIIGEVEETAATVSSILPTTLSVFVSEPLLLDSEGEDVSEHNGCPTEVDGIWSGSESELFSAEDDSEEEVVSSWRTSEDVDELELVLLEEL